MTHDDGSLTEAEVESRSEWIGLTFALAFVVVCVCPCIGYYLFKERIHSRINSDLRHYRGERSDEDVEHQTGRRLLGRSKRRDTGLDYANHNSTDWGSSDGESDSQNENTNNSPTKQINVNIGKSTHPAYDQCQIDHVAYPGPSVPGPSHPVTRDPAATDPYSKPPPLDSESAIHQSVVVALDKNRFPQRGAAPRHAQGVALPYVQDVVPPYGPDVAPPCVPDVAPPCVRDAALLCRPDATSLRGRDAAFIKSSVNMNQNMFENDPVSQYPTQGLADDYAVRQPSAGNVVHSNDGRPGQPLAGAMFDPRKGGEYRSRMSLPAKEASENIRNLMDNLLITQQQTSIIHTPESSARPAQGQSSFRGQGQSEDQVHGQPMSTYVTANRHDNKRLNYFTPRPDAASLSGGRLPHIDLFKQLDRPMGQPWTGSNLDRPVLTRPDPERCADQHLNLQKEFTGHGLTGRVHYYNISENKNKKQHQDWSDPFKNKKKSKKLAKHGASQQNLTEESGNDGSNEEKEKVLGEGLNTDKSKDKLGKKSKKSEKHSKKSEKQSTGDSPEKISLKKSGKSKEKMAKQSMESRKQSTDDVPIEISRRQSNISKPEQDTEKSEINESAEENSPKPSYKSKEKMKKHSKKSRKQSTTDVSDGTSQKQTDASEKKSKKRSDSKIMSKSNESLRNKGEKCKFPQDRRKRQPVPAYIAQCPKPENQYVRFSVDKCKQFISDVQNQVTCTKGFRAPGEVYVLRKPRTEKPMDETLLVDVEPGNIMKMFEKGRKNKVFGLSLPNRMAADEDQSDVSFDAKFDFFGDLGVEPDTKDTKETEGTK